MRRLPLDQVFGLLLAAGACGAVALTLALLPALRWVWRAEG